jgi:hypothetical protein
MPEHDFKLHQYQGFRSAKSGAPLNTTRYTLGFGTFRYTEYRSSKI